MTIIDISLSEAARINSAIEDIETVTNMIELLLKDYNKPWWALKDKKSKYHAEKIEGIRENNDEIIESIKELLGHTRYYINKSASILCDVVVGKINEVEHPNGHNEDDERDDEVNQ